MISSFRSNFKILNADTIKLISDRVIASKIQNITWKYIKQQTNQRALWNSPNIFKTIPCILMEPCSLGSLCGYDGNAQVAKSVHKLPAVLEGNKFGMLIQGVTTVNYPEPGVSRKLIESSPDRYANALGLEQRGNQLHFWLQDKHLYASDENIEKLKMTACFIEDIPYYLIPQPSYCYDDFSARKLCCSDTESVSIYDQTKCCPQNPLDTFIVPGYLMADVLKELEKEFLETFMRTPEDKTALEKV